MNAHCVERGSGYEYAGPVPLHVIFMGQTHGGSDCTHPLPLISSVPGSFTKKLYLCRHLVYAIHIDHSCLHRDSGWCLCSHPHYLTLCCDCPHNLHKASVHFIACVHTPDCLLSRPPGLEAVVAEYRALGTFQCSEKEACYYIRYMC